MILSQLKEMKLVKPLIIGASLFVFFFGGLLLWHFTTDLDTAAIAKGKVTVSSFRKTIQHLEGGIIKKLHIKENAVVKKGDVLVELDKTQAQANLAAIQSEIFALTAIEARLMAEITKAKSIQFPKNLSKKIMADQVAVFNSNQQNLKSQLDIYNQQIKQAQKEIESLKSQIVSSTKQIGLVNQEIKALEILEKKGLVEKPRLYALKREAARLEGDKGENKSKIARAEQKIGEAKFQILSKKDQMRSTTLTQLRETRSELLVLMERFKSAKDILARTTIKAPQSGKIVNLKYHTTGGVVQAKEPMFEIVPTDDRLIIEARVNPLDIDIVKLNLPARVEILAYHKVNIPTLKGKVIYVSADIFFDENNGEPYYTARIEIPANEIEKIKEIILYPGMPTTVFIVSQKKTPLGYLVSPILESFQRN